MIAAVKNKFRDRERVFAYGFDRAGFTIHRAPVSFNGHGIIEFLDFNSTKSLTEADGVIIPQGIFEKIETQATLFGVRSHVWVDKPFLLEREREIFGLLREGKWACFLVGDIIDYISQGIHSEPILDTDLCKRILNTFMVERRPRYRWETPPELRVRDEEFKLYVRYYGTPRTVFEFPHHIPIEKHAMVQFGEGIVGIEFDTQLFFLPFAPSAKDADTASHIARLVSLAIWEYRRHRIIEAPDWVDDFKFKSEEALYLEINSLLEKVNRLESVLASWKEFKAILATSGTALRSRIVALLETVFDFNVQIQGAKDVLVGSNREAPELLIQCASVDSGLVKASIEGLSRSRNAHGLPQSFPAVLFVNNDMVAANVASLSARAFSEEVVQYAAKLNVLIARTIDLLFLVRQLESSSDKKARLLKILGSGGGWLKADANSYSVLS